ncbi:hypothetical protein PARMER_03174 [Parabacteroides merdae ATCC 43184]|nr:hypothetical protein PARMER_03174 [Parabacteroides merdae ATCC 43184]
MNYIYLKRKAYIDVHFYIFATCKKRIDIQTKSFFLKDYAYYYICV